MLSRWNEYFGIGEGAFEGKFNSIFLGISNREAFSDFFADGP
jgi:hypothetical protein